MLETSLPPELQQRREDYPLITGHAHYVDDLRAAEGRPAILHMAVVRSPYAHAEIKDIQLDAARALPGVIAAFSGAELVKDMPTLFPFQCRASKSRNADLWQWTRFVMWATR